MSTISDQTVAFYWMGEGSATYTCSRRKEKKGLMAILGYRLSPRIAFINTDVEQLKPIKDWLHYNKIHFIVSIQKSKNPKYLPLTIIRIEKFKDATLFLQIILPHLVGKKRLIGKIMFECLSKYGGRGDWSKLMREKVIRDKKTGKILGINWNVEEERQRFLEVMKYRDKITTLNGGYKAKYNYAFFKRLWGM